MTPSSNKNTIVILYDVFLPPFTRWTSFYRIQGPFDSRVWGIRRGQKVALSWTDTWSTNLPSTYNRVLYGNDTTGVRSRLSRVTCPTNNISFFHTRTLHYPSPVVTGGSYVSYQGRRRLFLNRSRFSSRDPSNSLDRNLQNVDDYRHLLHECKRYYFNFLIFRVPRILSLCSQKIRRI